MPKQTPQAEVPKTWRRNGNSTTARKVELYSSAYKLAWEQFSLEQKRERPNIRLRIHASIRRQINVGAKDPIGIALAAVKDVLAPDTHQ